MTNTTLGSQLPVRIITPHSGLDAFRYAARSMVSGFGQARALAWRFFLRDTRADYRQSLLGYVWLVVPALANTLIWVFLNNQNIVSIDSGAVPYPVFVLAGTILWTAFNACLMGMLGVVNGARAFLGKVNFPHEALLYSSFLKSLLESSIAALILIPALVYFGVGFRPAMFLFPAALLGSLILAFALGLIFLPVAALYSDVSRAVQLALRFGFFLTPVIYPLPAGGFARAVMLANPVTPAIVTGRSWLTGSPESMPGAFFAILLAAMIVCVIGTLLYKVTLPHLIERISS